MNNLIIRNALIKNNVKYWELAQRILGKSDATLSRWLRNEMPEEEQLRIAVMIEDYAAKGGRIHE